jgi:hypothetical protein
MLDELRSLSKKELMRLDHDKVKVFCCVRNCWHYTRLRDFGVDPFYFTPSMKGEQWFNLDTMVFTCYKHYQEFEKNGWPPETNVRFKGGPARKHLEL